VFQTAGSLDGRFAAFGATLVALHPQLIFALPRNRQTRKLVLNTLSHGCSKARRTLVGYQSSISMTESSMVSNPCAQNSDARSRSARCRFLISAKRIEKWELLLPMDTRKLTAVSSAISLLA
jgi:hypothetical protein